MPRPRFSRRRDCPRTAPVPDLGRRLVPGAPWPAATRCAPAAV